MYGLRRSEQERRRRQQIEDELLRYRAAEAERQARAGAIQEAQTRDETGLAIVPSDVPRASFQPGGFNEPASARPPERILGLRRDVGAELGGVRGSFGAPPLEAPRAPERIRFGGVEQVGTPRAVRDEIGYDPAESTGSLEGDIARARKPPMAAEVGQALAGFAGRTDLSPTQQMLVGRGKIPFSALGPRRYVPTTRAEWLADMQALAGTRNQRPPITLDQAMKAVDRIYGVWDEASRTLKFPTLSPAGRVQLAQKLVSGTASEADFPKMTPDLENAPTAPDQPGFLKRLWQGIFGGGESAAPTAPAPGGATGPAPGGANRLEAARALLAEYAGLNLSSAELQEVLADEGFTPEEIRGLLGGGAP
jgi:hypothetical protein